MMMIYQILLSAACYFITRRVVMIGGSTDNSCSEAAALLLHVVLRAARGTRIHQVLHSTPRRAAGIGSGEVDSRVLLAAGAVVCMSGHIAVGGGSDGSVPRMEILSCFILDQTAVCYCGYITMICCCSCWLPETNRIRTLD
jgi:hypothetical protein